MNGAPDGSSLTSGDSKEPPHPRSEVLVKVRKKPAATLAVLMAVGASVVGPFSMAAPSPPTNGGNGAGQSGQCTGPAADRPAACQSP